MIHIIKKRKDKLGLSCARLRLGLARQLVRQAWLTRLDELAGIMEMKANPVFKQSLT